MELSKRLKTIAEMVEDCNTLVDVGTDHGYIPIYIVKSNKCNSAIAADINEGPVNKAKFNIGLEGLEDKIECRLGSGLSVVKPGEVQCAIIAGMGGNLIRDIIEAGIDTFKGLSYAILQPVQNPEVLRRYLYEKGFNIIDEELCVDEKKFYEIIKVRYGGKPKFIEDIYYEISPLLIEKKHTLVEAFIESKLAKYNKILCSIVEETASAKDRKSQLKSKVSRMEEMLKCL